MPNRPDPKRLTGALAAALAAAAISSDALGGVRDVQIVEVNTVTAIVTLRNLSGVNQPLDLYRVCTADDNEMFKYSSPGSLAGRTIEAGTEFRIHWLDDAPGGDPDAVNISDLGAFAGPLDNGPFGLAIYWNTPFNTPANMADYVQWTDSLSNPANLTADARAATAVNGGLWVSATDWVVTNPSTTTISLNDLSGGELHDSTAYDVDGSAGDPCPWDLDGDEAVGLSDLLNVLSNWGPCPGCASDLDANDDVGLSDLLLILANWGPCP